MNELSWYLRRISPKDDILRRVSQEFRKTTISFYTSLSLSPSAHTSVCPHGKTRLFWMGFHRNWWLRIFRKSVEEFQVSLISNKKKRYFTRRHKDICGNILLNSCYHDLFRQFCRENHKTFYAERRFYKNRADFNVEKYGWTRQDMDENMAHAHCMLYT